MWSLLLRSFAPCRHVLALLAKYELYKLCGLQYGLRFIRTGALWLHFSCVFSVSAQFFQVSVTYVGIKSFFEAMSGAIAKGNKWRNFIIRFLSALSAGAVVTWQLQWSGDMQQSTLDLTGLDDLFKRPNLINQLVMSSSKTYMIVSTIFF